MTSISVDVVEEPSLILKQEVGWGTYGSTKFHLCAALPDYSPIFQVGSKWYVVHTRQIVEEAIKALEAGGLL